jgi:L-threonylcarbamoyladenylate synthase
LVGAVSANTKNTLRLDGSRRDDVARAAAILRAGGCVAIPTETVYGLAARGLDPECVAKIYAAKGRPADNPLILHVESWDAARPLWRAGGAAEDAALARCESLAKRFWPGPLTLVSWRSAAVPDATTASLDKVAVRCPDHPVASAILALVGEPLAAPSANASGRVSPTSAADVLESLDGRIDAVVDGGSCSLGLESTVLDAAAEPPAILRAGALGEADLRAAIPNITVRGEGLPAHAGPGGRAEAREASPGLSARHYAPLIAEFSLASEGALAAAWPTDAALLLRAGTDARLRARLGPRAAAREALPNDPEGFARELYAALYRLERARPPRALAEAPPGGPAWRAVRDRLLRATASGG